jgi:class 3 adenylate cyclase
LHREKKLENSVSMKRQGSAALVIGLLVAVILGSLHSSSRILHLETAVAQFISSYSTTARTVSDRWQYVFILVGSLGVVFLTLTSARRDRIGWLVVALVIELIAVTWICLLYRVFFQPLPAIFAVVLGYAGTFAFTAITERGRSLTAKSLFGDRLSKEQVNRVIAGDIPFEPEAKIYDASVIVCDVANKYDLADECPPAVFAQLTETFIRRATELFLDAGGYIQSADGEGVVALFGFPEADAHHGDKAVRIALDLLDRFREFRQSNNGETAAKGDVHIGVSSGTIIIAPMQDGNRSGLLTSGEPIELARRFCVANRFYGSRILIGPRTFELASRYVVARPIDFLSGVNTRERHEIYEPLWLAAEAKPEQLARRDSFWNGVVLYREKRWAEAYMEFQKARDPDYNEEDAPLQLYLRRLEPLALHLTIESPEA